MEQPVYIMVLNKEQGTVRSNKIIYNLYKPPPLQQRHLKYKRNKIESTKITAEHPTHTQERDFILAEVFWAASCSPVASKQLVSPFRLGMPPRRPS
jgi:hypothetical protein